LDYWIKKFGLAIISIDHWAQLLLQESFTIKDMNRLIKDLHLETEVSLIEDDFIEDGSQDRKWIQKNLFFDYCLEDLKKGYC